jgi:hypothetical protein
MDHIERRGTVNVLYLRAMSHVYGLPFDDIEAAAKPPKKIDPIGQKHLTVL